MTKSRESAHLQMARGIALLMQGTPLTHTKLRDAVGVHKDVPRGWTTVLHAVGVVYVTEWQASGQRGPRMAAWAMQPSPFFHPDAPRPGGCKPRPVQPKPRAVAPATAVKKAIAPKTPDTEREQLLRVACNRSIFDLAGATP